MNQTETGQHCTIHDPRISEFLRLWHEEGRAAFERSAPSLDYDSDAYAKSAKDRRKYIALDKGRDQWASGCYLVDKGTGDVFTIKGYGVPNRKIGTLDSMIAAFRARQEA